MGYAIVVMLLGVGRCEGRGILGPEKNEIATMARTRFEPGTSGLIAGNASTEHKRVVAISE